MKISLWLKIVFFFVVFFSTIAFNSRIVFGASIAIDAGSFGNVLNGINSFSSGGFNFSSMNPAMLPSTYDSINQYLYSNFGYDVNDAIDYSADNLTGWATGQTSNPLNGASELLTSATTNFVANTMKAGLTAQSLLENGYQYFAQSVPQWGENAKQFFIGKVDDLTGAISDIGDGFVTKVTAQGLAAYTSISNAMQTSGVIYNLSESDLPLYGNKFDFYFVPSRSSASSPVYRVTMVLNYNCVLVNNNYLDSNNNTVFQDGPYFYYIKSGDDFLKCLSCTVVDQYGHLITNEPSSIFFNNNNAMSLDGVTVFYGCFAYGDYYNRSAGKIPCSYYFNSLFYNDSAKRGELLNLLQGAESYLPSAYIYNYADNSISIALKNQLDRLLDNYVDSLTLGRINDIIASIPIDYTLDGAIAVPTQAIVDELTGVIDQAIEDSVIYDTVFDAYYDDAIDTPAEPDPPVDDSDIYVPIDVPVTPIDTIGSALTVPYMFSSVFEPIFLAFGGGLFSLWLFVPTLIIFVAIIWAIK